MFNVTLTGDKELIAALEAMPGSVREYLYRAVERSIIGLQQHIKADKLEGQALHHRSGKLSTSIVTGGPNTEADSVVGTVASSSDVVHYAAAHEYGMTVEMVRRNLKRPAHLYRAKDGTQRMTGTPYTVNFKERSFMRSGLADLREAIGEDLKQSVMAGIRAPLGA